jgi:formylglycine-generating enzyme required for sulfatase activity
LFAAAKSGAKWRERTVSLDHPVVGIDWWDAAAYAEWKKGRLPSQEEWFAAMRKEVEIPSAIPSSDWVAVNRKTQDRTPNGLVGVAGSVSEWIGEAAVNPANPLGKKRWLLVGGSYLKPGSNALTREWLDERSTRRPDLGFRLVFDVD